VADGLLSVEIRGVPLNRVLEAITDAAKVELVLYDTEEEEITIRFKALPIEKGLKRILKGRDYVFFFAGPQSTLKRVEVYPRQDSGRSSRDVVLRVPQPEPESDQLEIKQFTEQALHDTDPASRQEAVENLGVADDEKQAAEILMQVLQKDERPDIRIAALEELADFDEEGGTPVQAAMAALRDSAQEIRLKAVEVLSDLDALDQLREIANSHDDPQVRQSAAKALEDAQ
jgi:HEAT repeat protein